MVNHLLFNEIEFYEIKRFVRYVHVAVFQLESFDNNQQIGVRRTRNLVKNSFETSRIDKIPWIAFLSYRHARHRRRHHHHHLQWKQHQQ